MRWDFVDDVLYHMVLGSKWTGWIQCCLHYSRASVLVNGFATNEFQFFRGLRQGDHQSPFHFILVVESLHVAFLRVVDQGFFFSISFDSESNFYISHLFMLMMLYMGEWKD